MAAVGRLCKERVLHVRALAVEELKGANGKAMPLMLISAYVEDF